MSFWELIGAIIVAELILRALEALGQVAWGFWYAVRREKQ